MVCPKCHSGSLSVIPAEIRLYGNGSRTTQSHPPFTLTQEVRVCFDCGYAELSAPPAWLSVGWLHPLRLQSVASRTAVAPLQLRAVSSKNRVKWLVGNLGLDKVRLQLSFLGNRCDLKGLITNVLTAHIQA